MSTKYIFDIDLTLYSKKDYLEDTDDEKFYNSMKQKNKLRELLLANPYKKYILTNGSFEHAYKVLEKLNLENIFEEMVNGYNLQVYKPTPYIYHEAQYEFEIDDKDKVYYFEDLKENLKISKELYNWITVLINPDNDESPEEYIDYTFRTIEDAMNYFTTIPIMVNLSLLPRNLVNAVLAYHPLLTSYDRTYVTSVNIRDNPLSHSRLKWTRLRLRKRWEVQTKSDFRAIVEEQMVSDLAVKVWHVEVLLHRQRMLLFARHKKPSDKGVDDKVVNELKEIFRFSGVVTSTWVGK